MKFWQSNGRSSVALVVQRRVAYVVAGGADSMNHDNCQGRRQHSASLCTQSATTYSTTPTCTVTTLTDPV